MPETLQLDLVWMTLLIFLPAVFALTLLAFPGGRDDYLRWWALTGTAATLGVALSVGVLYDAQVLERLGVTQDHTFRQRAGLANRAAEIDLEPSAHTPPGVDPVANPARSADWVARRPWVPKFGISYFVGIDGIGLGFVLLTAGLFFFAVLASWGVTKFVRGYLALLLLLETGLLGVFLALDLFLFYAFWAAVLLPVYFLVGVWGGPERVAAAFKTTAFLLVGAVLLLLAIVGLSRTNVRDFVHPGVVEAAARDLAKDDLSDDPVPTKLERARERVAVRTFDLTTLQLAGRAALQHLRGEAVTGVPAVAVAEERLAAARKDSPDAVPALEAALAEAKAGLAKRLAEEPFFQAGFQYTLFGLLFVAFGIVLPVVPLHTWLPAAQVEAPTPVAMLLAGVLVKLGGFGLLRVAYPVCPWPAETLAWWLGLLGVVGVVYGALACLGQQDLKKLVAYHSVSVSGYVLLGLSAWKADRAGSWAWAANGAVFLMLAHGFSVAVLVYLAGAVAERVKHRRIDLMGGLAEPMPATAGLGAFAFFTAMGVPGLCGFVGLFMVVVGAWAFCWALSLAAILALVVSAGTLLWTWQRVFLGTNKQHKDAKDATGLELFVGVGLVVVCLLLGLWPMLLLDWTEPSVTGLIDTLVRNPG